jgi:Fur family peroxide stress response transcriptional regulator
MTQLVERLHQVGLKATGPRLQILAALVHNRTHPTVEQLYQTLRQEYPSLSLSTVYQTLETFLRTGLCRRVTNIDDRLRVDGTPQDHDHAICRQCGTIFDIDRQHCPLPPAPDYLPQDLMVTGLRLEYEVICVACRTASEEQLQDEGSHA